MTINNTFKTSVILITASIFVAVGSSIAEPQTNPRQLRIMSYNIRHGVGMDLKLDLKRIAAVISKTNPDLIALQEIDNRCGRSGNIDIAAELGKMLGMQHRFGKFMDYGGGEYGMAVLSKLHIKETIRHQLPKGEEPRCALEVKVDIPGKPKPLSFICIHNDWITEEIRIKQIGALLDNLKGYKNPIILAGDFNGKSSDKSIELLRKNNFHVLT
jgi:endonuclease/exonuclease/phosphatase family metal-dependent hydrolase